MHAYTYGNFLHSLNLDRLAAMKFFFAVADEMDTDRTCDAPEENPNNMLTLLPLLTSKIATVNTAANHDAQTALSQALSDFHNISLINIFIKWIF